MSVKISYGKYNPVTLQQPGLSILSLIPIVCLMAAVFGCASTSQEPSAVVMRNGTEQVLSQFRVHEVTASPLESRRFGQFTSVPPKSNQYVTRRKNAPPLPSDAVVIWQATGGPEHRQPIDLNAVVRKAHIPGGILIIEVRPNHTAHAFITARPD